MFIKRNVSVSFLFFYFLTGCSSVLQPNISAFDNENIKKDFDNQHVLIEKTKEADLKNWWSQFNDKDLIELINKAQGVSPTIEMALLNIKNYELSLKLNQAADLPMINFGSNLGSSVANINSKTTNYTNIGFQSSWEIDLFNKNKLNKSINEKQVESAKANWHDAKVLIAANTAKSYFNYKFCNLTVKNLREDYLSRENQKKITELNVSVGLENKSSIYLSEAKTANAKNILLQKETECQSELKAIVAITGLKEKEVFDILQKELNQEVSLYIPKIIPGQLIEQRPDVFNAKKSLELAIYNLEKARLQRYPNISIGGNIYSSYVSMGNFTSQGTTWSIGPLMISVPVFDGGRINANEWFANQQINYQKVVLENSIHQAIKEVEINLLNLSKIDEKYNLFTSMIENYRKVYLSTLKRYEVGLVSLYELEDAKIAYLNAQNAQISVKKERLYYWIDLYKSVGGGFKNV